MINHINAHGAGFVPPVASGEGEYRGRIDYDALGAVEESTDVRNRIVGFDSTIAGTDVVPTSPSRGQGLAWMASLQPASRTVSKLTRPQTLSDDWPGQRRFEMRELEEAISEIAGEVAQAGTSPAQD